MPLIHGHSIEADEVESEISYWSGERFARLCNAIAWARSWKEKGSGLPAFTERVLVHDNGIDAEWKREFAADAAPPCDEFLRAGLNVFQFKKRATGSGSRNRDISNLKSAVRGEVGRVERRTGKHLASYLLWTNIHLTTEQNSRLQVAICGDEDARDSPRIAVVGAAELAAMLDDLPHLRSAFFATASFRDWGAMREAHRRASVPLSSDDLPAMVGRDREVQELRTSLVDPGVRAIVITGPLGIGKARLAIETTVLRDIDVVESLEAAPTPDSLVRLCRSGRETIVVLREPDRETAELLVREAALAGEAKLVITLETREDAPLPGFGNDSRVRVMQVAALPYEDSRSLLQAVAGKIRLDYNLETWILQHAGGVPGVIVAAGAVGPGLRPNAGAFAEQVGAAYERRARARLTGTELDAHAAASLLTHVRIEGDDYAQLRTVCGVVGIELNGFLNALDRLEAAGLVRRVGSYVEAVPPALANLLAARAIRGRPDQLVAAFEELDPAGRTRLLRRLALIRPVDAAPFWRVLFGTTGRLGTLAAVLRHAKLFAAAAAAAPPRAAQIVYEGLERRPMRKRRRIAGTRRRNLIWALEDLLSSAETGEPALRSLALLAEVENENIGNNATGVFVAALAPLHTQMPLALDRRLAIVRELAEGERSEAAGLLAIAGAEATVDGGRAISLRPSRSARPQGGVPSGLTWGQVWSYLTDMLQVLERLTSYFQEAVRHRAKRELPRAVRRLALVTGPTGPATAVRHFRGMVEAILECDFEYSPHDVADSLAWCRRAILDVPEDRRFDDGKVRAKELQDLLNRLLSAGYATRLRILLGGWSHYLAINEKAASGAEASPHDNFEVQADTIAALAQEACDEPGKLDRSLLEWTTSVHAQRGAYFWAELGRCDVQSRWTAAALSLGHRRGTWRLFLVYLTGVARRDHQEACRLLEEAAADSKTVPAAVAAGAIAIEQPVVGAARLQRLVVEGKLQPEEAANSLIDPSWLAAAEAESFLAVAEAVVGGRFERAGFAIQPLWYWFHRHKPTPGDPVVAFAWRCLNAAPVVDSHNGSYYADDLASLLAELEPEKGFSLLRNGLRWMIHDPADNLADVIPSAGWGAEQQSPAGSNDHPTDACSPEPSVETGRAAETVSPEANDTGDSTRGVAAELRARLSERTSRAWVPIERYGQQRFWKALRKADRFRALAMLLDVIARGGAATWLLSWHLQELLDMPGEGDFLRSYSQRGEAEAEAVAEVISSHHEGFWDLACDLVERWPWNQRLRSKLGPGVEQLQHGIRGRMSDHYLACVADIEHARDKSASERPHAQAWLEELAVSYRRAAEAERNREENRDIDW